MPNLWADYRPKRIVGGTAEPSPEQARARVRTPRVKNARACVVTADNLILDAASAKQRGIVGKRVPSRREANWLVALRLRERAGQIRDLRTQVDQPLCTRNPDGLMVKVCSYRADFVYVDVELGEEVVADAKGWRTEVYSLKKKWWEAQTGRRILEL